MPVSDLSLASEHDALAPRVVVLKMQFHVMTNYNYLVIDPASRKAVIVDPAWQMEKVDAALAEAQVELSGILITHSHPDHLNLAVPLARHRQCPIWMSSQEVAVSGFRDDHLVAIDGAPWHVGNMRIEPVLTPGHTPGCVCFLIGRNLFTGDVLFAEGCGMCPDVAGAYDMFDSLEYLRAWLDPQTRIYPGHSYGMAPGQPFARVLRDNIYLQFDSREAFAAFRLRPKQNRANVFGQ